MFCNICGSRNRVKTLKKEIKKKNNRIYLYVKEIALWFCPHSAHSRGVSDIVTVNTLERLRDIG